MSFQFETQSNWSWNNNIIKYINRQINWFFLLFVLFTYRFIFPHIIVELKSSRNYIVKLQMFRVSFDTKRILIETTRHSKCVILYLIRILSHEHVFTLYFTDFARRPEFIVSTYCHIWTSFSIITRVTGTISLTTDDGVSFFSKNDLRTDLPRFTSFSLYVKPSL